MAVTIDATVAGTDSNSYVTKAEASAIGGYHDGHLYSSIWTIATSDNKNKSLVMAARLLDQWVDWKGYRATEEQALRWPRYDVQDLDGYTFDSDIIPQFLKDANAEFARLLLASDTTAIPDTQGFKSLKLGDLALEIDSQDRDAYGAIPDSVLVILEPYGQIRRRGNAGARTLLRV